MVLSTIRDYLQEAQLRLKKEWQTFLSSNRTTGYTGSKPTDFDLHRYYDSTQDYNSERHKTSEYEHNFAQTPEHYTNANIAHNEPFDYPKQVSLYTHSLVICSTIKGPTTITALIRTDSVCSL
ncbi:hypothetical protein L873DRAFT_1815438 [Choiromyces venosus 120613-1]|uniref:Uncharacterized protein n=1 Tax=Choiromyces venosus 120613-1 TaxID=1336337 RepID=A0A3N4J8W1_9PEZI|nr:hypothetical protein L873DRAFT_1815438 [Choiromyces venosus 120613-1]